VNLALTTAQNTVGAGTDTISNFENIFASAFNDTLTGNSAANTINGGAGNDLIVGGQGSDILTGGLGADTFQFLTTGLDTNFDRITDFSSTQGDKINIQNILVGYDAVTKAITDYVEFTTVGANTEIKVDRDGLGTTYGWQQIAQLDNVTGVTDEAALKASGNLIA
jgi:Ca2+-binding RTX toxin-like protein